MDRIVPPLEDQGYYLNVSTYTAAQPENAEVTDADAQFLEDMAIFLVAALPWLIVIGLVGFGIRLIVKKRKNHKKQKENA